MTAATVMSDAGRREALTDLARNWNRYGETVRCSAPAGPRGQGVLKDPRLPDFWDTFLGELALLDGINGEPWAAEVSWADVNDELTCPDRTDAARDEMTMRVAGVLDLLTRGPR